MNRCDCPTELDEERLRAVLATCPPRDRLLVELGFETGLRISELLSLRVEDLWDGQEPARVLRVGKGRLKGGQGKRKRSVSTRVIPLNDRAREAIMSKSKGLLGVDNLGVHWAFPSRQGGGPLTRRQASRIIRGLFLKGGCAPHKVWAGHSLRRRFVTRIYEATQDINLARAAVGHRWVATTQLYLGLDEGAVEAAILRVGEVPAVHSGPACPASASGEAS